MYKRTKQVEAFSKRYRDILTVLSVSSLLSKVKGLLLVTPQAKVEIKKRTIQG